MSSNVISQRCPHCNIPVRSDRAFCDRCARPNAAWWVGELQDLTGIARQEALKRARFFPHERNVLLDKTTNLLWQQAGSDAFLNWHQASAYVDMLNQAEPKGGLAWRIPALEELSSLLVPVRNMDGLFIDPLFDSKQKWCWSSTRNPAGGAYAVFFFPGSVLSNNLEAKAFVRAVKSLE